MRQLKLNSAFFYQVAYLDAQHIVSMDTIDRRYSWRVWDLSKDEPPIELTGEEAHIARRVFSPNGIHFLRVQGYWPDGALLPTTKEPDIQTRLRIASQPSWFAAAFAPDGATILYREGSFTGGARTHYNLCQANGESFPLARQAGMFHTMYTTLAGFSPDGKLAAMSSGMKDVAVWDLVEHREVVQLEQGDKVRAVTFVTNDRLAVAAGRTVRLWDLAKREVIFKPRAFKKFADTLAVSPDQRLLAAGSRDGLVRLWDTTTGCELKEYDWGLKQVQCVAFSPDGTTAAATGVGSIVLWDID